MIYSPFEQFELQSYVLNFFDISFTLNDTILISFLFIFFFQLSYLFLNLKTNYFFFFSFIRMIFESTYVFMYNTIYSYLSEKTKFYFPFLYYLFLFICISNLIGMIPYSFTITSHLMITFSLAFIIWWGIVLLGFYNYGLRFFEFFFVPGVPFRLSPFLILIEFISFVFRSVSLALRLFANIVAGHILLDTVALSVYNIFHNASFYVIFTIGWLPIFLCIVLIGFEFVVALLQGYIFVILSAIYLKDIYVFH
jgi:ATP synthase subunit 6